MRDPAEAPRLSATARTAGRRAFIWSAHHVVSVPAIMRVHGHDSEHGPHTYAGHAVPRTHAHQRESFCVKRLVGASSVVCPCIAVMGLVPAACDRVGETTGGAAHDVRRDHRVSQCRVGLAPTASLSAALAGQAASAVRLLPGAVGGDARVPGLAGGDHGVQVPQDRGGDDGLGLGGRELVVLAAGQVLVAGAVDGVGALRSPDRAPGRQPQPGSALPGEFGAADERAGQFLPRREPGVLDQRAGGGEPARVAGLGQDRRGADRRRGR